MQDLSRPHDNRLLAALGQADALRLQPYLERVFLTRNQPIYTPGETMSHAYFPTTLLASLMHITQDGDCAESALVGNDGMLGLCLFMSDGLACDSASALTAGEAFRIPAAILRKEFNRAGATMRVLLRYTQVQMTQTAQRAICTRRHLITQQVALCLLQQADHASSTEVLMTQEQIALRLGVRREGVTEGAGLLQKLGLIRYARGHIEVLDREGLEEQACECYAVLRNEYQRLLPVQTCKPCLLAAA